MSSRVFHLFSVNNSHPRVEPPLKGHGFSPFPFLSAAPQAQTIVLWVFKFQFLFLIKVSDDFHCLFCFSFDLVSVFVVVAVKIFHRNTSFKGDVLLTHNNRDRHNSSEPSICVLFKLCSIVDFKSNQRIECTIVKTG